MEPGGDGSGRPVFRRDVEGEVREELDFHLEMRVRELVRRGWTREAAREEAMRWFGDLERLKRECASLGRDRERRQGAMSWLHETVRDVRYAFRQLRGAPVFSVAAVLVLALGIGGTTALFSVLDAVVLRPYTFERPERLVTVWETWQGGRGNVSAGNYVDWLELGVPFERMAALRWASFNIATDDAPERVLGVQATHEYFAVFGVAAAKGRVFLPEEDAPGRSNVVVLSHELWERRYEAAPDILDRVIRLNDEPYTVVGVMPEGFDPFTEGEQLWVPIAFTPERRAMHDEHYLTVVASLPEGIPVEAAERALAPVAAEMQRRFPEDNAERGIRVDPLHDIVVGPELRTRLFVLMGAVGLVLLIACGNVASLLLARGAVRVHELGVRVALGAGRSRLVRQLLTESVVLALTAAIAGTLVAFGSLALLVSAAPPGVPHLDRAQLDGAALMFALLVSVASGIVFGLVPALGATRQSPWRALGGRGTLGGVRNTLRGTFVAVQVALAFTLLAGAGLLIRSAVLLGREDPGFRAAGVLSARVSLPPSMFADGETARRAFTSIARRLEESAGIEAAGLTSQVPAGPGGNSNGLVPEGRPLSVESAIDARLRIITPGYFAAMAIPIVRGRGFTEADVAGGLRVMVVSQLIADLAWPGEDPIGKRIICCEGSPEDPLWKTVVGVAGNVQWRGVGQAVRPEFYLPIAQAPAQAFTWIQGTMTLVGRSPAGVDVVADAMRASVRAEADVPLYDVRTMQDRLRASFATSRFNAQLLAVLGAMGLLLAAIGIWGVVAYHASRRAQEMGLRMALGATTRDILALVATQALKPVAAGLVLGLAGAFAATRVLRATLFGVTPTDATAWICAAVVLGSVAFLASVVPAHRAATVDPASVLTRS